ncbi:hypothetical protein GQ473_07390 [archaeon]|nr:hypothetical protein [archaeon]
MISNYVMVFIFMAIYSLSGAILIYLMYRLMANYHIIYEIIPPFFFAVLVFIGSGILTLKRLDLIIQKRFKGNSNA